MRPVALSPENRPAALDVIGGRAEVDHHTARAAAERKSQTMPDDETRTTEESAS